MPAALASESEIHLRDYLYVLRKRRGAVFLFLVSVLALSVALTFFEKVLYRATAVMLIERENPNVVDFKEVMAFDAATSDYYQTQHQILKSRSLVRHLIEEEELHEDPYLIQLIQKNWQRFLSNYRPWLGWLGQFLVEPSPENVFIQRLLKIDPVRNSRLVEVSVVHPDPVRAARITNRLVELFIERNLEERFSISTQASELISGQLGELKEKVAAAERKLQGYKEEHDLVNIPSIREKNEFLQEAKLELVKIQAEEAKVSRRYLPAHPKRIHLRSQIEGLTEKIQEEEKKILGLGRIAIDYAELEREAQGARQLYEALLERLGETTSQAQTQASNILIVDRAVPPARPYKPQPLLNFLVAFFLGTAGGVLLAFFIEYLDSSVRIPDDIERGLNLELLGIIPQADRGSGGAKNSSIYMTDKHPSATSESFRALRTALLFRMRYILGGRVILVTSPNPEEGKSTVTLNLAVAFSQNHLKVLLVDADLRRPRLHKVLNMAPEKGLTEVLEGESKPEDMIRVNAVELGIDFLSSGAHSAHPAEILGSQTMRGTLKALQQTYDIILIDSPPYLAVADVAILSEYASAIVVVARYHRTDRRHLKDVKKRFGDLTEKVFGVVINGVGVREKDYYYHQYYYYGYGDAIPKK